MASAAEPPQAVVLASAPCKVVAPRQCTLSRSCYHRIEPPEVAAHAAEPSKRGGSPQPLCNVAAPSNVLSAGHVTTVEPPEVAALAAELQRCRWYPPVSSHPVPVTAIRRAACELSPCPVTARKAVYELTPCPARPWRPSMNSRPVLPRPWRRSMNPCPALSHG